jgi:hypothetical protein
MFRRNKRKYTAIFTVLFLFFSSAVFPQKSSKKKNSATPKPILWESVNIAERSLFLGPGGEKMQPDVSKITFIKEEKGGSSKKFRIKDAAGNEWVAKVGHEAQPETAAVRLVWALGYKTEINYLVPSLTIPSQGKFKNVRLEARPENVDREGRWSWKDNPFSGTDELIGLKIMMALLNNWDLKDEGNNIILEVEQENEKEIQYAISDLGATFGRTGYVNFPIIWRFGRHINRPDEYGKSKFINKVDDGEVEFSYVGRNPDLFDDIKIEETRFITNLLTQLGDKQIRDAFRAANYTPQEINILTEAVKRKIGELEKIKNSGLAKK